MSDVATVLSTVYVLNVLSGELGTARFEDKVACKKHPIYSRCSTCGRGRGVENDR